jgi:hypothetical protein
LDRALTTSADLLGYWALGDTVPTPIEKKTRIRPDDSTLIDAMEDVLAHLIRLDQEALALSIKLDLEHDAAIADRIVTPLRPTL